MRDMVQFVEVSVAVNDGAVVCHSPLLLILPDPGAPEAIRP